MIKEVIIANKNFEFITQSGKAIGVTKQTVHNTYSSRGGGVVIDGFGFISPSRIHTTNHSLDEFFLKMEGKEMPISLFDYSIALRDGHNITLIWGSQTSSSEMYLLCVLNHDTDKKYQIVDNDQLSKLKLIPKKIKIPIFVGIIVFFIPTGMFLILGNFIRNKYIDSKVKSIRSTILSELTSLIKNNLSEFEGKSKSIEMA